MIRSMLLLRHLLEVLNVRIVVFVSHVPVGLHLRMGARCSVALLILWLLEL